MRLALTFKYHMFSIIMFLWVVIQTHKSQQTHLLHLSNRTHLFVISSSLLSISAPPCSALQLLPNHFSVQVQSVLRLVYVLFSPEHSNCLMFSANGKCSQWACWCAVISNTSHHETRLTGLSRRRQQILWQESVESTSLFPVKVDVCCRNSRMKPHKQFGDLSFYVMLQSVTIKSLLSRICSICGAAEWLRGGQQRLYWYIDESSMCEQSWRRLKHKAWFVHCLLEYFSFRQSTFFSTMRLMIGYPLSFIWT